MSKVTRSSKRPERDEFGSQQVRHSREVCARTPVFSVDLCALAGQRRMLGADEPAEGKELGSNILKMATRHPAGTGRHANSFRTTSASLEAAANIDRARARRSCHPDRLERRAGRCFSPAL